MFCCMERDAEEDAEVKPRRPGRARFSSSAIRASASMTPVNDGHASPQFQASVGGSGLRPAPPEALVTFLENYYIPEVLQKTLLSLARPPACTTLRANTLKGDVPSILEHVREALRRHHAEAAREGDCPDATIHPLLPDCICIASEAPPADLQSRQVAPKAIVVDVKCGEAVLRGSDVFAVGVLAASSGLQPQDEVAIYADLTGKLSRGATLDFHPCELGEERCKLVGLGVSLLTRAGIFRAASGEGGAAVQVRTGIYGRHPPATLFDDSLVHMINAPSMLVVHALDPQPGERVVDLCAAPGGKTAHIAALMKNEGLLVSLDRSRSRVNRLAELCQRLGVTCVLPAHGDSSKLLQLFEKNAAAVKAEFAEPCSACSGTGRLLDKVCPLCDGVATFEPDDSEIFDGLIAKYRRKGEAPSNGSAANGHAADKAACPQTVYSLSEGLPPGSFDRVLLDPPCSGLGQRPRLSLELEEPLKQLEDYASYQRVLIRAAVDLLRPGGVMTYSTCTLNPLENEANVRYALDEFPCLSLVDAVPRIGGQGLVCTSSTTPFLAREQAALVQRFEPSIDVDSGVNDTIGFFVAKFVKS
eukprot:TRINITY_DN61576_c0_g1_i1.p1 TRINITY_DN61576_c0_g1~~TRINITY_DN61576_c0_g1_i1.p1  ORF type:complete len:587 (-),score=124.65 TRINITY_DN61576_c0_g1_i1:119-1879(-)